MYKYKTHKNSQFVVVVISFDFNNPDTVEFGPAVWDVIAMVTMKQKT